MKAMVLNEYGEQANFELTNVDKPALKPGEVLVRVSASSINTVDTMIKQLGTALPFSPTLPAILGMDFAAQSKVSPMTLKAFRSVMKSMAVRVD